MLIAEIIYPKSHRFHPNPDSGYQKPSRANPIAQGVSL
jgi:hypothetical protein